jgi:hypothetical protein
MTDEEEQRRIAANLEWQRKSRAEEATIHALAATLGGTCIGAALVIPGWGGGVWGLLVLGTVGVAEGLYKVRRLS